MFIGFSWGFHGVCSLADVLVTFGHRKRPSISGFIFPGIFCGLGLFADPSSLTKKIARLTS